MLAAGLIRPVNRIVHGYPDKRSIIRRGLIYFSFIVLSYKPFSVKSKPGIGQKMQRTL